MPLAAGRDRLTGFLQPLPETGIPRVIFSSLCKKTAREFTKYVWKREKEDRVAGEQPIDKHCDAIKALTYGLIDHYGHVEYPRLPRADRTPREQMWRQAFRSVG